MQVLLAEQILRRQEVQEVQTLVAALEAAVKMFMQAMWVAQAMAVLAL